MSITSVLIERAMDGQLRVSARAAFEGKPPSQSKHRSQAAHVLREALAAVEAGQLEDTGFAEGRKSRTQRWEVK